MTDHKPPCEILYFFYQSWVANVGMAKFKSQLIFYYHMILLRTSTVHYIIIYSELSQISSTDTINGLSHTADEQNV